jgi:hypothetical protein
MGRDDDWKERELERLNKGKRKDSRSLKTIDDLCRFWKPIKSYIKEDEIDKIDLQYDNFNFRVIFKIRDEERWGKNYDFLFDSNNLLDISEPDYRYDYYKVPLYKITKTDGGIIQMVLEINPVPTKP